MFCLSKDAQQVTVIREGEFTYFGNPDSDAAGALAFCINRERYEAALANSNVVAVIATEQLVREIESRPEKAIGIAERPRDAYWETFSQLQAKGMLHPELEFGMAENCRVHSTAVVSDKARIGRNVRIGAHAVIGDYSDIGDDCEIHEGCVVGSEGMQLYHRADGRATLVRHAGGVRLGQSVSMLAKSMVSKAVHPVFTQIGDDTCLSLMVSVGHQSRVGRSCRIAGNSLLGGSVRMGDDVFVGPSVTIKDGIQIGDGAKIRIGSVVISDVAPHQEVSGNFALDHVKNLRHFVKISHG